MFLSSELRNIALFLSAVLIIALLRHKDLSHPALYSISFDTLAEQPDNITCGPTSAIMILRYYGIEASLSDVKKKTKTVWYTSHGKDFGMTAPALIQNALMSYGLNGRLNYAGIDRLKNLVARGKPCIVLVRSGEWNWHYVVVTGYERDVIYFANPASGKIEGLVVEEFEKAWNWQGDLLGRECSRWILFWLRGLEIYPYSIIYID